MGSSRNIFIFGMVGTDPRDVDSIIASSDGRYHEVNFFAQPQPKIGDVIVVLDPKSKFKSDVPSEIHDFMKLGALVLHFSPNGDEDLQNRTDSYEWYSLTVWQIETMIVDINHGIEVENAKRGLRLNLA